MSWIGLELPDRPGRQREIDVLDAIDFCLGARRNLSVSDTDFFGMDVHQSISIALTVGDLPESLLNLDAYGEYLRGFDSESGEVEDEPRDTLETVLTLQLVIAADLEPIWRMFSERTRDAEPRALPWKARPQRCTSLAVRAPPERRIWRSDWNEPGRQDANLVNCATR